MNAELCGIALEALEDGYTVAYICGEENNPYLKLTKLVETSVNEGVIQERALDIRSLTVSIRSRMAWDERPRLNSYVTRPPRPARAQATNASLDATRRVD